MKTSKQVLFLIQSLLLTTSLQCFAEEVENIEDDLIDSSLEDLLGMETELKADIGSRSGARNFLESRSPLDVITFDQIDRSGLTSLTDVLRYFVAGFNAPETAVADGSDHVRAFTLRGMSPDQILVLVNGKRLHTGALLHVNSTIGRGSSGVDLDTVAVQSIETIEILRDGAAAQYGSDAIAGVINITLKKSGHKNSLSLNTGIQGKGDGGQVYVDGFYSLPLKYDGFANLTVAIKAQDDTQRTGSDTPTRVGKPEAENYLFTFNSEIPQKNNLVFYTDILFNYRNSDASAFFRSPEPDNESKAFAASIYPNGFLPIINAQVLDYSMTFGVNGEMGDGYFWDISNVYGYNQFHFYVSDTINYSLGTSSPTQFDNGELNFTQNTTNASLKKTWGDFNVAAGIEYRFENYGITAGEFNAYTETGTQGLAGFRPENETDSSRHSYAFYLDSTYQVNKDLSLEVAGRFEDYSDFGDTFNVKLASAYKVSSRILLRASGSTGFRAPSLAQSHYSHSSSFSDMNGLSVQGTFPSSHPLSQVLGAKALSPESSFHFSIGSVYQPTQNSYFMIDYFYTKVDNRIMLSNQFRVSEAQSAQYNIEKARYFTNAVDTETQGVDVKFNYKREFDNESKFEFSIWYNFSHNKVVKFNDPSITLDNSYAQIVRMEHGQPQSSLKFLTNYQINDFDFTVNVNRFGTYQQVLDNIAYNFAARWTVDLDIAYNITDSLEVAIGGNNIFSEMPNKWQHRNDVQYGSDGIKPYSRYSPFGYSGGYYYLRTTFEF